MNKTVSKNRRTPHRARSAAPDRPHPGRQPLPNHKPRSRIFVGPLGIMRDFWGRPLARPLSPNLIRTVVGDHLHQPDNLLVKSLQMLVNRPLSAGDLKEVKVVLFQEGDFQHIFQVTVHTGASKPLQLAMVVAKNSGRISQTAADELSNLHEICRRDPQYVVRPLSGGLVPIHPASAAGPPSRSIFIYLTTWLAGLHELGVDQRFNFFINELPFHAFDRKVGELLRGRILTILFSLYDPDRQRAMAPPQIASGDFVISRPRPDTPYELRLIACRKILSNVTLGQCLRLYLGYHGDWADKTFHLLPKDPLVLAKALQQGLVEKNPGKISWDQIRSELHRYIADLSKTPAPLDSWSPLAMLRKLIGVLP